MTYCSACPFYKTLQTKTGQLTQLDQENNDLLKDVKEVFDTLVAKVKEKYPSTKNMSWEVNVKQDGTVNAFCCPGGKVVITTGILTMLKGYKGNGIQRKDLIAAVLGHEIVHAVAEHSAKRMQISIFSNLIIKCAAYGLSVLFVHKPNIDKTLKGEEKKKAEEEAAKELTENRNRFCQTLESVCSIPSFLLQTGHSQSNEFEADEFGMQIAHEANYNVRASVSLQEMFLAMKGENENQQKGWFQRAKDVISSHPPSQERLQKNQEIAGRLRDSA